MIRAEVSSGRSLFDSSSPTNAEVPGSAGGHHRFDGGGAALAGRLERRRAHRDHLLGILGAHGLHRIAGIDQALEGIRRDHLGDLGNLHDIEQRGDPRHEVLGGRGGRRHDGVVARRQGDDQRRHRLGQHVIERRGVRDQHLADPVKLCGRGRRACAIAAGDQHVNLGTERQGGRQRLGGRVFQAGIVMLGDQKGRHHSIPASFFSLPTSSATEPTLPPALRAGGSAVLSTSSRGAVSTP